MFSSPLLKKVSLYSNGRALPEVMEANGSNPQLIIGFFPNGIPWKIVWCILGYIVDIKFYEDVEHTWWCIWVILLKGYKWTNEIS